MAILSYNSGIFSFCHNMTSAGKADFLLSFCRHGKKAGEFPRRPADGYRSRLARDAAVIPFYGDALIRAGKPANEPIDLSSVYQTVMKKEGGFL